MEGIGGCGFLMFFGLCRGFFSPFVCFILGEDLYSDTDVGVLVE